MHQHDTGCAHVAAPPIPAQPAGTPAERVATQGPPPYPGAPAVQGATPYPPNYPPAQYVAPQESRAYRFLMALWTRPSWLAPLAVLACIGAAFTYVLANDPTDARRDPLGPCAFKAATGLDCPGCGGTRMVWYLLHADLGQAARHHIVALVAVPVVAYLFVVWAAKRVAGLALPSLRIPGKFVAAYLTVWVVFSVLRNLPWEPFNYFFVT